MLAEDLKQEDVSVTIIYLKLKLFTTGIQCVFIHNLALMY